MAQTVTLGSKHAVASPMRVITYTQRPHQTGVTRQFAATTAVSGASEYAVIGIAAVAGLILAMVYGKKLGRRAS